MKIEEIRELHEMGFSAEQIMTLTGTGGAAAEPAEPEAEETEPAEPAPEPEADPARDEQITGLQNQISEQQKQIQQLTKQIQAQNRQQARIETLPEDDLLAKTDKIMAELIRPTYKEDDQK